MLPMDALAAAISIAGSEQKLAEMVGLSQGAIAMAKRRGQVSDGLAARIDHAMNGQISKHDLCPEAFGPKVQAVAS